jgi:hypothetical protein
MLTRARSRGLHPALLLTERGLKPATTCSRGKTAESASSRKLFSKTYLVDGSERPFLEFLTFKMLTQLSDTQTDTRVPRVPTGPRSGSGLTPSSEASVAEAKIGRRRHPRCRGHIAWLRRCFCANSCTGFRQHRSTIWNSRNDTQCRFEWKLVHSSCESQFFRIRCGRAVCTLRFTVGACGHCCSQRCPGRLRSDYLGWSFQE